MKTFYLIYLFILSFSSAMTQEHSGNKIPDEKTERGTSIISAELVQLQFEAKNGKITDYTEWYVRRSVQDYFIKFCESGITRKELEKALKRQNSAIKSLTMEVEFKEGCGINVLTNWFKAEPDLTSSFMKF